MTRGLRQFAATSVCVALCCAVALSVLLPAAPLRSPTKNGDGRPDSWRTYDHRGGQLAEVSIDTNRDGRVDLREFYERGRLVRRESDRDFNDVVDLVQEFDPVTRQLVRTVSDVDSDGVADLLVLFRGGKVVLSKWSQPAVRAAATIPPALRSGGLRRHANSQATPLVDPFLADLSMRNVRLFSSAGRNIGLLSSQAVPSRDDNASPFTASSAAAPADATHPSSTSSAPRAPRAPPSSSLIS